MHFLRIIPATALAYALFFHSSIALSTYQLNDVMSQEEQAKTGVSKLSSSQRKELENWINQNFVLKTSEPESKQLYISESLNGGAQIRLSDNSLYEIAPQDRNLTSVWISAVEVKVSPGTDPSYPVNITNTASNTTVKARRITSATN